MSGLGAYVGSKKHKAGAAADKENGHKDKGGEKHARETTPERTDRGDDETKDAINTLISGKFDASEGLGDLKDLLLRKETVERERGNIARLEEELEKAKNLIMEQQQELEKLGDKHRQVLEKVKAKKNAKQKKLLEENERLRQQLPAQDKEKANN